MGRGCSVLVKCKCPSLPGVPDCQKVHMVHASSLVGSAQANGQTPAPERTRTWVPQVLSASQACLVSWMAKGTRYRWQCQSCHQVRFFFLLCHKKGEQNKVIPRGQSCVEVFILFPFFAANLGMYCATVFATLITHSELRCSILGLERLSHAQETTGNCSISCLKGL